MKLDFPRPVSCPFLSRSGFSLALAPSLTRCFVPAASLLSRDPATDSLVPPIEPGAGLPDWVFTEKLVAKPDQLIKRRGKAGLLCLNKDYKVVAEWIKERAGKPVKVRSFSFPNVSSPVSLCSALASAGRRRSRVKESATSLDTIAT